MNKAHSRDLRTPKKRRIGTDLSYFLIKLKVAATEIAATIVFLVWLYRILMHEIGR